MEDGDENWREGNRRSAMRIVVHLQDLFGDDEDDEDDEADGSYHGETNEEHTDFDEDVDGEGIDEVDLDDDDVIDFEEVIRYQDFFDDDEDGDYTENDDDDDDDDDDDYDDDDDEDMQDNDDGEPAGRDQARRPVYRIRPHSQGPTLLDEVPNPIGAELANNGEFGYVEPKEHELKSRRRYPRTFGDRLFRREMSYVKYPPSTFTKNMIPHVVDRSYIPFLARNYSGQFSEDGSFFFTASQDFKVRMFDTSNHDFPWKLYKTVHVEMARWTVTDASLSNDNRFIAYSSIAPTVHLASTSPDDEGGQEALDFGEGLDNIHRGFGIWSLRFSADGREIVAGANNCCLYVYDIETKKTILRLTGHEDEVNAVCFGDESGNILYSGSDDQVIKVWDRRSMGYKQEAGVLLGHVEGITYIDSKKDGRYLLSNGKDQTMKLWDIRKLMSSSEFSGMANRNYSSQFDYRYQRFPRPVGTRHPRDCSVMTYAGHHVLRTLIRCHFGPASATGSQYVYSGSSNGKVHIWSLDGQVVQTLNARLQGEPSGPSVRGFNRHQSAAPCVRDASWHPYLPIIATSSWDGFSNEEGSVMLHRWRDRTGDTLEGEDNAVMQAASIPDYGETYYDGSYDYF